jgi:hypothetical protein
LGAQFQLSRYKSVLPSLKSLYNYVNQVKRGEKNHVSHFWFLFFPEQLWGGLKKFGIEAE